MQKMILKKDFLKLMNNAVFVKTIGNVRRHSNMKLLTTETRRNYLVSKSNFHATVFFSENLLPKKQRNKKNHEKISLFSSLNIRTK